MFLSIGMLKQKYFLADIFILSAEKQPIKLSWRKIECLLKKRKENYKIGLYYVVFVILFPLFSILIMELMTIII
jgi:hypothetical protein